MTAPIGRHLAKPSSDADALRAIDSGREGFCGTVEHRSYGSNAGLCWAARSLPFTLPPTAAPHPPGIAAAGIRALGRSSWDGVGRPARRDRSGAQPLPWGKRRFGDLHQRLQGGQLVEGVHQGARLSMPCRCTSRGTVPSRRVSAAAATMEVRSIDRQTRACIASRSCTISTSDSVRCTSSAGTSRLRGGRRCGTSGAQGPEGGLRAG